MSSQDHSHGGHLKALDASMSMYPRLGRDPMALLNTLFVLLTTGQVLLTILFATIRFSKQVRKRNATMLNLLLVTILGTISQPLLYYGEEILNPNPPFGLCITQAILKYGSDPMSSVVSLAMILEILFESEFIVSTLARKTRTRLLIVWPYMVFLVFALIAAGLGAANPSAVKHMRDDYYCSLTYKSFRGIEIFSCCIAFSTVSLQVYTVVRCRSIWRNIPHLEPCRVFGKGFVLRVLAFTVCQLFLFVLFALDFYFKSVATHVIPIVYEALMPLTTFLIFASSPDVLAAWMFWTRRQQSLPLSQVAGMDAAMESNRAQPSLSIMHLQDDGQRPADV